ncbi:MAG TPA: TlpA disulfide reductase family protein [Bryobacteraceae bacterium]|nr:TlpA disulfide reductase family protein [Bryobacteraceae bacterium]
MKYAVAFLALFSVAASAQQSVFASRRAPGFSLPDQKMKQHDLQDYRGKVVVFDFMRTDCPKCQALTPVLEQLKAKYGDKIQVLSVVPANGVDNLQTVARYATQYKATSPFLFDCGQMTASYLQITPKNPTIHLPSVVVVDKVGMIRKDISEETSGGLTLQTLTTAIDPLLK